MLSLWDVHHIIAISYITAGSEDRTCIVWDLNPNNFGYIRRLRGHSRGIVAVSVNHIEGDIAACTATDLR